MTAPLVLLECEKEPIHIPGLIQPYGCLLVLEERSGEVVRASANAPALLNLPRVLGEAAQSILEPVEGALDLLALVRAVRPERPVWIRLRTANGHTEFDATVHRHAGALFVELEPASLAEAFQPLTFQRELEQAVAELQGSETLHDLCAAVTSEVRRLTGFDRVMVYRFDEEWNGAVTAESVRDGVDSYLGQHFPASDIPAQARQLFMLSSLRMIPDVRYTPAPIHALVPDAEPLDLSRALLRSSSPIHLEYLRNMEVEATLTVSLIREGKLWGLITAHHATPRHIPFVARRGCELLGRITSSLLRAKEENEDLEYKQKLKQVHAKLLGFMTDADDFVSALVVNSPNLLELTSASGAAAAILFEDKWTLIGKVPHIDHINGLVHWLATEHARKEVFHTHELPKLYPPAEGYKDVASGLLAISIPKSENNYVLWFRPEVLQTVPWAGNPEKSVELGAGGLQLHPRKSFALWKEEVKSRSLPWKRVEIEAAAELRKSITEIDLARQFLKERVARADVEAEKQRFVFLAEASGVLSSSLQSTDTLTEFAALATRRFCDWCVIHLWRDGSFERAVIAHATEEGQRVANELLEFPPPNFEPGTPFGNSVEQREPLHVRRVTREWVETISPNEACTRFLLERLGLESLVATPLWARGQALGLITFARSGRTRRFQREDASFAMELGRRVSSSVDNMRLYREAIEATQAREHVMSVVSHDLRTPLNAVQLGVGALRRRLREATLPESLTQSFAHTLQKVESSCKRMGALVDDILSLAKIDAGRFEVAREPVRIEALLREAEDVLQPLAEARALNLRVVNTHPSLVVDCEPARVMQVFTNLVGNAIKFTPPQRSVTLEVARAEPQVVLAVRDEGPGIPAQDLPHVFDRFWQASRTSRQGAGLGLAIVKGIVEAHGGEVWADSTEGQGSTFWFSLPRAELGAPSDPVG